MVSKKSISSQLGGKKCDNPDKQKKIIHKSFRFILSGERVGSINFRTGESGC